MARSDPSKYPAAMPHGPIEKVAPDVFFAPGSIRLAPFMHISRNMVIVRSGTELTLVNPIRLSADGEAALRDLGTVRHAMRLGNFHGVDDPYTVQCFGAELWRQPGCDQYREPAPDHELVEGGALPIVDAELFVFRDTTKPESALLIKRQGGVLITCDSVQHYGSWDRHSPVARLVMKRMGFSLTTLVGPIWLKGLTPKGGSLRGDFDRLLALPFDVLLSAHGTPLRAGAHSAVEAAVARAFQASPSQ